MINGTVMQIIKQQIYDCFNTDNKHGNFHIYSCPKCLVIEPESFVYKQKRQ